MVDSPGLENRYSSEQRTIEGSNPSLSFFCSLNKFVSIGFARIGIIKKGGVARLSHLAKPEKIEKSIR